MMDLLPKVAVFLLFICGLAAAGEKSNSADHPQTNDKVKCWYETVTKCRSRLPTVAKKHPATAKKVCFPAMATVTLESGSHVTMADLNTGDRVLTVSEDGKVTSSDVRVFLKRDPDDIGLYTRLTAEDGHEIALSPNHIIYTSKMNNTGMAPRFASTVETGDYIFTPGGEGDGLRALRVTDVTTNVAMEGVYLPLTAHGTLLVDDIYASCYASFPHDLSHVVMTPIRWFPTAFTFWSDKDGSPAFVRLARKIGHWVMPHDLLYNNPLAMESFTIS